MWRNKLCLSSHANEASYMSEILSGSHFEHQRKMRAAPWDGHSLNPYPTECAFHIYWFSHNSSNSFVSLINWRFRSSTELYYSISSNFMITNSFSIYIGVSFTLNKYVADFPLKIVKLLYKYPILWYLNLRKVYSMYLPAFINS